MSRQTFAAAVEEAGPEPDQETLDALYDGYEAEGHLISYCCLTHDDDMEAESWVAKCTCGATSAYEPDDYDPDGPVRTGFYDDVRWWSRGHRAEHGLAWQQWHPNVHPDKVRGEEYMEEGHCVVVFSLPDALVAACSCGLDGGEPEVDVNLFKSEQEAEVRQWADEHRVRHGLAPQAILPPVWRMYSPPEVE